MTFLELMILIQDRGETVVSDKTHLIQTDKFSYYRSPNGGWEQRDLPAPVEDKFPPLAEDPLIIKKKKKK